jgi:hypothetical protein
MFSAQTQRLMQLLVGFTIVYIFGHCKVLAIGGTKIAPKPMPFSYYHPSHVECPSISDKNRQLNFGANNSVGPYLYFPDI